MSYIPAVASTALGSGCLLIVPPLHPSIVSRSQTVTLAVTVWTTAVERFVLSSPGSRVGDKCEQYRKGHEYHYLA